MGWVLDHLILVTMAAVCLVMVLAAGGFYLSLKKFPTHPIAIPAVNASVSIAVAIIFSVALNQLWGMKRDQEQRIWTARSQHLARLQALLRAEAIGFKTRATPLSEYHHTSDGATLRRDQIWTDDVLTADVGRHFPDYATERERLLQRVIAQDVAYSVALQRIAGTLERSPLIEPYWTDLVLAVMNKCKGSGPGMTLTVQENSWSFQRPHGVSSGSGAIPPEQFRPLQAVVKLYETHKCNAIEGDARALVQSSDQLVKELVAASLRALSLAEQTVLSGDCQFVPPSSQFGAVHSVDSRALRAERPGDVLMQIVNTLGLLLSSAGGGLLWWFGLPPDFDPLGRQFIAVSDRNEVEAAKGRRYRRWGRVGVALMTTGALVQLVAVWV